MAAEIINIKTDLDEAIALLEDLDTNQHTMRKRILKGIGNEVKNVVKKDFRNHLKNKSGILKKSVVAKIARRGNQVVVTNDADNHGVRYGFALAKGFTITPKKGKTLTFKIGDKWIRRTSVTVPARDWFEGPAKHFMNSSAYQKKIDSLMEREVILAERRAEKARALNEK